MNFVLGVAGSAKNTGKTTAISSLILEAEKRGYSVGITSIGYDGEETDNITGLPKPRLKLKKGTVVAVAEKCIKGSKAKIKILETTNIKTPLGKVIIGLVEEDGLVVIAGPNKKKELKHITDVIFKISNCSFLFVDGALSRIAPMTETKGMILATGAARTTNIEKLAEETKKIIKLSEIEEIKDKALKAELITTNNILFLGNKFKKTLNELPILTLETSKKIIKYLGSYSEIETIYIPGIITFDVFKYFLDNINVLKHKTFIIESGINLILSNPSINRTYAVVKELMEKGLTLKALKKTPLLAITINPFYPVFKFAGSYEPGYVDKKLLKETISKNVDIPVFDVVSEGSSEMFEYIVNFLSRREILNEN